jgi:hypothetical protein
VVPSVATTHTGRALAATSWRIAASSASGLIANRSSTGIFRRLRRPSPATFTSFSIEEWVSAEQ